MIDERNEEDPASPGAEQQHGAPPKQKNFFTAFKRIQHIFSNNTPAQPNTNFDADDDGPAQQPQKDSEGVFAGSLGLFGGPSIDDFYKTKGESHRQAPSTLFGRQQNTYFDKSITQQDLHMF